MTIAYRIGRDYTGKHPGGWCGKDRRFAEIGGVAAYPRGMQKGTENTADVAVQSAAEPAKCPVPKWGRRLGAAAFMFFLIKGLLWLAVPALVAMGLFSK
jgi:hypothetical protein